MKINLSFWVAAISIVVATSSCSSIDREGGGQGGDLSKSHGVASGVHESRHLNEGITGIWWSTAEDFFVAGLHKSQDPEPPLVGVYFGSLKDPAKRTI